jgi:hypothetical protein
MEEEEVKRINELQQATHQDIYWNPGYGAFPYDSQQPSHKNDLLCQMQQGCNLHTHNPGTEGRIRINDSWLYHNKFFNHSEEKKVIMWKSLIHI